jgi:hypothetical protein
MDSKCYVGNPRDVSSWQIYTICCRGKVYYIHMGYIDTSTFFWWDKNIPCLFEGTKIGPHSDINNLEGQKMKLVIVLIPIGTIVFPLCFGSSDQRCS